MGSSAGALETKLSVSSARWMPQYVARRAVGTETSGRGSRPRAASLIAKMHISLATPGCTKRRRSSGSAGTLAEQQSLPRSRPQSHGAHVSLLDALVFQGVVSPLQGTLPVVQIINFGSSVSLKQAALHATIFYIKKRARVTRSREN